MELYAGIGLGWAELHRRDETRMYANSAAPNGAFYRALRQHVLLALRGQI
jgi:hypothetical protein